MFQDFLDNLVYMTFEDKGGFWLGCGIVAGVILVYQLLLHFAPKAVAPIHRFFQKHPLIWICIPAAALIYFVYVSLGWNLWVSVSDWEAGELEASYGWGGFGNYVKMFSSGTFWPALKNTLLLFCLIPLCLLLGLGNLDAKLRDQVRYELKKIQEQLGITTIYVTHDQTEAMTMADHIVLMKDGHIMQQGTPNDLYNHPANEFVAGFLGTPQINLFPCDVKEENGHLILDAGDFRLRVPEREKAALTPYVGKTIDLGVRPSDFELAKEGVNAIHAHVDSIEPLGDAYLIYVRIGKKVVVFKYAGEYAPEEQELLLSPNMDKLHFFDPDTGNRINQ